MAYKVRFTLTRPNTDTPWQASLSPGETDTTTIPALLAEHNGAVDGETTELSTSLTYSFESQADWSAFYNAALPIWNSRNLVENANNAGITIDVSVIENT